MLSTQPPATALYWWNTKGVLLRNASLPNCTTPTAMKYDAVRDQLAVLCYIIVDYRQIQLINVYDGQLRMLVQLSASAAGPLFSTLMAGLAVSMGDGRIVATDSSDNCVWTWPRSSFDHSSTRPRLQAARSSNSPRSPSAGLSRRPPASSRLPRSRPADAQRH